MDQLIRPPKPNWVNRTLNTFRENPSLVVSTASLIVAIAALFLTYVAQMRDAYYRELSIRPRIVVQHNTTEFRFSLVNLGLGPAVIKKVTFALGDKCYDSSDIRRQLFSEYGQQLINYFLLPLIKDLGLTKESLSEHSVVVHMREPGSIIDKGERVTVFTLQPALAQLLHERLAKLGPVSIAQTSHSFHVAAIRAELFVEYCSLSGAYCDSYGKVCVPKRHFW